MPSLRDLTFFSIKLITDSHRIQIFSTCRDLNALKNTEGFGYQTQNGEKFILFGREENRISKENKEWVASEIPLGSLLLLLGKNGMGNSGTSSFCSLFPLES
ncbi:hypothetical protein SLEP1_g19778 [Rubroshorea leprosula]|uniref:Uncharacterized protein n=1 Tax=Rubroshorea leprosula TaxID=152421 RepID=A0AAV5JCD4_9ROSI|nr:hypothetical protein SLEP1_g19778 [Rubroshorea leprosula]